MGFMIFEDILANLCRPWKMNFVISHKCVEFCRTLKTSADQSLIVEGHSISKSKLDNYPLPEENEESRFDENCSSSSWDGLVTNAADRGWSLENSTDRSFCSNSSWAEDDEFGRQATCQVRKMFDDIERALFEDEEKLLTSPLLREECQEWKLKYPHLRIVGSQLLPPQDLGYQELPRSPGSPDILEIVDFTEDDLTTLNHSHGLAVIGKHLNSLSLNQDDLMSNSGTVTPANLSCLKEEIFEEEGCYEEFLAFDNSLIDKKYSDEHHRKTGEPPITPISNIKYNILSAVFDLIWTETINGMSNILKLYCDHVLKKPLNKSNSSQRSTGVSRNAENSLTKLPLPFPFHQISKNSSQKQKPLDGVLTVSSKTLLSRSDKTSLIDANDFRFNVRPTSGPFCKLSFRPLSVRADLLTSSNSRQPSARKATPRGGRLLPLEAPKSAVLLGNDCLNMHAILRGTRLPMSRDCILSPTLPVSGWSRSIHTPLPPIDTIESLNQSRQQSHHLSDNEEKNHLKVTSISLDTKSNGPPSAKFNSLVSSHRSSTGLSPSQGFQSPFALRGQNILTHSGKASRSAKTTNTKSAHYHHHQVP